MTHPTVSTSIQSIQKSLVRKGGGVELVSWGLPVAPKWPLLPFDSTVKLSYACLFMDSTRIQPTRHNRYLKVSVQKTALAKLHLIHIYNNVEEIY